MLKDKISNISDIPPTLTLEHALAEVDRELAVRKRIYDDWIHAGKMAYCDAYDRYTRMLLTKQTLEKLLDLAEQPA